LNGNISLVITNKKLDFELIDENIPFIPSFMGKAGCSTPGGLGKTSLDSWMYSVPFQDDENINDALYDLLKDLDEIKDFIKKISKQYKVVLYVDITSLAAEIEFTFEVNNLNALKSLGLDVEFSVYSWGGKYDEEEGEWRRFEDLFIQRNK
jgi:hypothetical protein